MRIPGWKIWRAFRELDEFSDEKCRRFVKRASPWGAQKVARAATGVLAGTAMILGTIVALALLTSGWDKRLGTGWEWTAVVAPVWVAGLTICLLPVLAVRDLLLRRRIRYLLDSRASCAGCGYILLGLPVGDEFLVVCPECGTTTRVDRALGELAVDASGRARFLPRRGAVDDVAFFWTVSRRRFVKKTAWRTAVVVTVALMATWATFEVALLVQAVAARTDVDWSARLRNQHSPRRGEQEQRTWDEIAGTIGRYERIEQQSAEEVAGASASGLIRFRSPMYFRERIPALPADAMDYRIEEQQRELQAREISRRAIRAALRERIFSKLDACEWGETAPGLVMPASESPLEMTPDDGWKQLTWLSQITNARMASALDCGDSEEFEAAYVLNERLSAAFLRSPSMLAFGRAYGIEEEILRLFLGELARSPRMEFVVAMDRMVRGMSREWPTVEFLNAERTWQMACLQWMFSSPDRVRWGTQSNAIKKLYNPGGGSSDWKIPGRFGWYWENREEMRKKHSEAVARIGTERWEQTSSGEEKSELFLVNLWQGSDLILRQWVDRSLLLRRTVTVMLALERFRLANGDYPIALSEIEESVGADDSRDPYSGQPFRYKKVDDLIRAGCAGSKNRIRVLGEKPYLLYTVGGDGNDDFGTTASLDVFYPPSGNALRGLSMPIDLLLNVTDAEWESACEP